MMTDAASPSVVALPSMRSAVYHQGCGDVPLHSHEEMELVMVLQGTPGVQTGEAYLESRRGDLFIFPAKTAHDQRCRGRWRTLCVLFANTGRLIEETPRVVGCARESRIRRWMEELAVLHSSSVPAIVSDCLLLALLTQIGHFEDSLKTMAALPPALAKAVRFLEQRAGGEVDAGALVRHAGVSYSRLGALFRAHFGCAPLQYHQRLRMDLAKRLLLNPYASIDEIAGQAGFADANYFCRLFRKVHGVAPGKWRREAMARPPAAARPGGVLC